MHVNELHNTVNVHMVEIRRKRQILTCIWRNIEKGIIVTAVPVRGTRYNASPTIYLPVPKTELFKKSVYYYGATLWNSLPPEVRICDNIKDFKTKLYNIII